MYQYLRWRVLSFNVLTKIGLTAPMFGTEKKTNLTRSGVGVVRVKNFTVHVNPLVTSHKPILKFQSMVYICLEVKIQVE